MRPVDLGDVRLGIASPRVGGFVWDMLWAPLSVRHVATRKPRFAAVHEQPREVEI